MSELSQTQARGLVDRLGNGSPKAPGPLRVYGVSRDIYSPAVLVAFNRTPTDEELRGLQDRLTLIYTGRDDVITKQPCIQRDMPKGCYRVRCQLENKCQDDDLSPRAPALRLVEDDGEPA